MSPAAAVCFKCRRRSFALGQPSHPNSGGAGQRDQPLAAWFGLTLQPFTERRWRHAHCPGQSVGTGPMRQYRPQPFHERRFFGAVNATRFQAEVCVLLNPRHMFRSVSRRPTIPGLNVVHFRWPYCCNATAHRIFTDNRILRMDDSGLNRQEDWKEPGWIRAGMQIVSRSTIVSRRLLPWRTGILAAAGSRHAVWLP